MPGRALIPGTSRAGKPRAARPSRRTDILDVAARTFFENGFDRTSMRDIAASVGITAGSIFYHFASKDQLLVEVIEEGIRQGHEVAERELVGAETPLARFRALILGHLRALHDRRHMHKVSVQEWDRLSAEERNRLRQTNGRYRVRWASVLEELRQDGVLRADPEQFRRAQIASLNWTVHYREPDLADLSDLADRMAASSLNLALEDFRELRAAQGDRAPPRECVSA